jgi:hypothetical protein
LSAGKPVRFGGGKLAPDSSRPKLRARWEPTTVGRTPPAAGRHATPDTGASRAGGPLTGEDAERVWRDAERIVHDSAQKISADTGSDPVAAADPAEAFDLSTASSTEFRAPPCLHPMNEHVAPSRAPEAAGIVCLRSSRQLSAFHARTVTLRWTIPSRTRRPVRHGRQQRRRA